MTGWVIWGLAAFFYGYEFTLRVAPSTMIPELMQVLHLDAAALGSLSAYYFYAYALFQIPAGLLIDRFGARYLLTLGALSVTVGNFALGNTSEYWVAALARTIIGAGSAVAFVGCLKIAQQWLKAHQFPFVVGLTSLCGTLGALAGGAPLAYVVHAANWWSALALLTAIGALLTVLLFLVVKSPEQVEQPQTTPPTALWPRVKTVLMCKQTFVLGFYGCLVVAPIAAFAELWSIPFLMTAHDLSRPVAATLNSCIFIGIAIGAPTIGFLFGRYPYARTICGLCSVGALTLLSIAFYTRGLPTYALAIVLLGYGFLSSHMLLCFTLAGQMHSTHTSGTAIGFINTVVMAGGALFQPIIGWLLDRTWDGTLHDGIRTFQTEDFYFALRVLPICLIVAFILSFFIKSPSSSCKALP